ncbi:hypothetical protein [Actinacidiphila oryziradicis]|uniref:hypothetical protein n=1 Tax=Actinacidiphila oryziradicis TaxID=2571141 RepID=UPI001B80AA1F|nr:hypothetical protein [Actinacidiphila oryziradicis]
MVLHLAADRAPSSSPISTSSSSTSLSPLNGHFHGSTPTRPANASGTGAVAAGRALNAVARAPGGSADVANLVASVAASGYLTGEIIVLDGGRDPR